MKAQAVILRILFRPIRWTLSLCAIGALLVPSFDILAAENKPAEPTLPTNSPYAWAMATDAIHAEANGRRHDLLRWDEPTAENVQSRRKELAEGPWAATNKTVVLAKLKETWEKGHRERFRLLGEYVSKLGSNELAVVQNEAKKDPEANHRLKVVIEHCGKLGSKSILAWDYVRYISLCRRAHSAGYLTEAEAWELIMPAARRLQETFDSWEELGRNYLIGRQFWSLYYTELDGRRLEEVRQSLLSRPTSPWRILPWSLDLRSP